MLRNSFKRYVRNRPRFFRKLGYRSRRPRALLSSKRVVKTPNRVNAVSVVNAGRVLGKRKSVEHIGFAESFLRKHPWISDKASEIAWKFWDNGGRYTARGALKMARRGQLKGRYEL